MSVWPVYVLMPDSVTSEPELTNTVVALEPLLIVPEKSRMAPPKKTVEAPTPVLMMSPAPFKLWICPENPPMSILAPAASVTGPLSCSMRFVTAPRPGPNL